MEKRQVLSRSSQRHLRVSRCAQVREGVGGRGGRGKARALRRDVKFMLSQAHAFLGACIPRRMLSQYVLAGCGASLDLEREALVQTLSLHAVLVQRLWVKGVRLRTREGGGDGLDETRGGYLGVEGVVDLPAVEHELDRRLPVKELPARGGHAAQSSSGLGGRGRAATRARGKRHAGDTRQALPAFRRHTRTDW